MSQICKKKMKYSRSAVCAFETNSLLSPAKHGGRFEEETLLTVPFHRNILKEKKEGFEELNGVTFEMFPVTVWARPVNKCLFGSESCLDLKGYKKLTVKHMMKILFTLSRLRSGLCKTTTILSFTVELSVCEILSPKNVFLTSYLWWKNVSLSEAH